MNAGAGKKPVPVALMRLELESSYSPLTWSLQAPATIRPRKWCANTNTNTHALKRHKATYHAKLKSTCK